MSRSERTLLLIIMILGGVGLILGWRSFWFLTDDAYIAFRYISNSQLGYGYVWNAPPFYPVEGYTSFLWIVILDAVWRTTGIDPPGSANWISLGFSYGSLLLGCLFVMRIQQHSYLKKSRPVFVALLVAFMLLNRTFLAWTSSGLETAMMTFLLLLWVYVMLGKPSPCRACFGALTAACLALARPDGLLFCGATGFTVLLWAFAEKKRGARHRILLCGLLPFCIVVWHLLWRMSFYGEWLPNTYYAKVLGPWPESGLRYLRSFILEYAFWFPGLFVCWAFIRGAADNIGDLSTRWAQRHIFFDLQSTLRRTVTTLIVAGSLFLHFGYYTYAVGGDHFEYRVYTHLVPLIFVALLWSLNRLAWGSRPAIAVTLACVLLSLPVQWTHRMLTKDLNTPSETHKMWVPIAHHWPKPVRWYAQLFDKDQSWLIYHFVCIRHQGHKIFGQTRINKSPTREQGLAIPHNGHPLVALPSVGVMSWVLPRVHVIDVLGLNDWVIARTPKSEGVERFMAHDRQPPAGYVESYRPNVRIWKGQIIISERCQPVTSDYIVANERYWRKIVESGPG